MLPGYNLRMFTTRCCSALVALAMLVSFGCAKNVYVPHPNAASTADSQAFDILKATQKGIEDAKAKRDQIPGLRAALHDKIIPAYNVAEAAYMAYHKGLDAGAKPNAQTESDLVKQILTVQADIGIALKGGQK